MSRRLDFGAPPVWGRALSWRILIIWVIDFVLGLIGVGKLFVGCLLLFSHASPGVTCSLAERSVVCDG